MADSVDHTHATHAVPADQEDAVKHYGPDGMSPRARKEVLQELDGADPPELVARAWTESPVENEHAYLQLLGGCVHYVEQADVTIANLISHIKRHVPDPALDRLPALTTIGHNEKILQIGLHRDFYVEDDDWKSVGTEAILGPVAELLQRHGAGDIHPKALADATSQMMSSRDKSRLESIFNNSTPRSAETTAAAAQRPAGSSGAAEPRHGPRANDPNITPRSWPRVKDIQIVAQRRWNGISVGVGGWYSSITVPEDLSTVPPDRPHSAAIKARVDLMPDAEIQALLEREPDGSQIKYFDVPDPLYDRIIEWRPQLKEHKPLMAIFQKNLLDYHRDEDWTGEGDCTGMKIGHAFVFAAFGMTPQVGWNLGLSAAMLWEIYRRTIDEDARLSGWNQKEGKARIITAHAIPADIITGAKRAMLGPNEKWSWTYLINGKDAGDRYFTGPLREERREQLDQQDPAVEPPEVAKEIQRYLNGLPQKLFGHGGYGALRPEQLAKAAEAAAEFPEERRRDQANRKLIQMRTHPQPLYDFCDRFPRQKADPYNQAMNLPAELRRPMYTSRDYEVDLDKAHFASYVPAVRREGIEVPTLDKYLAANLRDDEDMLERGDLWWDLISEIDADVFSDRPALRTAGKRAYSSVYGSGVGNMLFRIYEFYATLTGEWPNEGTEPLKAMLDHPLMDELFETRDKLEAIITSRGGLEDANGRFVPIEAWDETKDKENRWRGVMAYVNCSFEQEIMGTIFREAQKELDRDGKTRFKVWLYQGDGVTIRVHRDYAHEPRIARLQKAAKAKADELGVPTRLEVDWPE